MASKWRQIRQNVVEMTSDMPKWFQDDVLLGPKSGGVEFSLVLQVFLKGSKGGRGIQELKEPSGPDTFWHRKSRFLVKHASCRFGELCFLPWQGAHVCKNRGKIWPESETCTHKTLDGEFDAYVCGLGGAKRRKCWKTTGFTSFFEGSRGARGI